MWKLSLLLVLSICGSAAEITYSIQTLVGSSLVGDGGVALSAQLSDAQGLAIDRFGVVYIADADNHRVRRVSAAGIIETVAGTGFPGFSGDGGLAVAARLNAPYGVAVDGAGNIYIADLGNNRVRRISADGVMSTVAGTGAARSDGDGGAAVEAQLHSPRNVAVDAAGNLYISEFEGHRIRRVTGDGLIRTVAGNGVAGAGGDGGAAISAGLAYPAGMTFDFTGALYIADSGNQKIRRVFDGAITTMPVGGFGLSLPTGIASDGANGFYIADSGNRRVLRRMLTGAVMQVSGNLDSARDVATDGRGNLLIADGRRVRLVTSTGLSTLAGDGTFGFRGDGGAAALAVLNGPDGVAIGTDGSVYVADGRNHRVRKVSAAGDIATIAGNGGTASPEGLSPTATAVIAPEGLYADPGGAIWIGERYGARVRRLTPGGAMVTIAGTGESGFNGDFRAASSAQLQTPGQVALDSTGALYIADAGNNRIRKVTPAGVISTVAGTGVAGFSGDGGPAVGAQLNQPRGIAFDSAGNLYIADTNNHRVRRVAPGGLIGTVAGDGELALRFPRSVAADLNQNLYICDTENHRIVRRSAEGVLSVIAGTGGAGFSGDGGAAVAAQLKAPSAIALDPDGNLFVADLENNRIRKLTPVAPASIAAPITPLASAVFLHAATLSEGAVAPGEILSIAADGIGPWVLAAGEFDGDGLLPTTLSETRVLFDGRAAPLFDTQQNRIRVQVPYEVAEQATTLVELYRTGERRVASTLAVTRATPGIFTVAGGTGPAMVANSDGALNWEDNPANPGSLITLYVTGEGQTYPAGISGQRSTAPYRRPAGEVVVRVGGRPAELVFVGEAPEKVGILQIGAIIPSIVNAGAVNLSVSIGPADSQGGVTVFVK